MTLLADWRYCPRCRAELEGEDPRVECRQCGFVAYATPSPTACALVTDERGRLLLARRRSEVFDGRWDIPGGFVEEHEDPLDALRRELREETGLEVEPLEFVGAWPDVYSEDERGKGTINLYWTARVVGGTPEANDDVAELAWFEPDGLPPEEEIAFRNVPLVLRAWREQHAQR